MERRLAAILAADVVGYSHLMEADEEGTLRRLRADFHDLIVPKIAEHNGRLVKTTGDGLLAEFHSVVDAVRCALDLQRGESERNADLPPDRRIVFRMGINLGDVIAEDDDLYGDGVNVAARLEGLADAGGVMLSGTAYDQLKKKVDAGFEFLGEQRVKNIADPVRVYRVLMDAKDIGRTIIAKRVPVRSWKLPAMVAVMLVVALGAGAAIWLRPVPPPTTASLVVLPFENLSDDAQQGYLSTGITEDLTTDLARIPGLFVISRTAAANYSSKGIQPTAVARELNVRYLLEGSVRRVGDQLRINIQLIDGATGLHKWAERFDGAWADIFSLQDKLMRDVADALEIQLVWGPKTTQAPGATAVAAAYEAYLRGSELADRDTPEDLAKAVPILEEAVALDPNYGQAQALLAYIYQRARGYEHWEKALGLSHAEVIAKTSAWLQEAMKHPTPLAYQVAADRLLYEWRFDEAIANLERAIALDPSDVWSYLNMGGAMLLAGRTADGKSYIDAAARLYPRSFPWLSYYTGLAQYCMDQFEQAASAAEISVKNGTNDYYNMMLLAAAYGQLGRSADAAPLVKKLDKFAHDAGDAGASQLLAKVIFPFKERADRQRFAEGLRKAGVPELPFGYDPASKDRLTGEEMKSLLFGHTIRG
ncbi:MAG: adenylate/guanylate cyclase domain-containing protein, partial [Dongiaceae bacterium]